MSFKTVLTSIFSDSLGLIFESAYTVMYDFTNSTVLALATVCLFASLILLPSTVFLARIIKRLKEKKGIKKKKGKLFTFLSKYFSDETLFYIRNSLSLIFVFVYDAITLHAINTFYNGFTTALKAGFPDFIDMTSPDSLISAFGTTFNLIPILFVTVGIAACVICIVRNGIVLSLPCVLLTAAGFIYSYNASAAFAITLTCAAALALLNASVGMLRFGELVKGIFFSAVGIAAGVVLIFFYGDPTYKMTVAYIAATALFQVPLVMYLIRKSSEKKAALSEKKKKKIRGKPIVFLAGAVFLFVFCGICIPSIVISSAPQDFVDINYYHNPLLYIVSSAADAFGIFAVWLCSVYFMSKQRTRAFLDVAIWVWSGWSAVNYFFFGKNFGIMSVTLEYKDGFDIKLSEQAINAVILLALAAVLIFVAVKFKNILQYVLFIGIVAILAMSVTNAIYINSSISPLKEQASEIHDEEAHFTLSKDGKNVIVFMTDRAIGCYIPYLTEENPELLEKFDGFTYYSNTISYGRNTNFASPAIFGGYEYTPANMNARDDLLLEEKNDEALKIMPVLFDENGYDVTVLDPPYAGYQNVPDLSIYDDYPDIKTGITKGTFTNESSKKQQIESNYRNFFCYSILKTSPLVLQETLYNNSNYNNPDILFASNESLEGAAYTGQVADSVYTSKGVSSYFMNEYNVIDNLDYITDFTSESSDTFTIMVNAVAHDTMLLQEPEYTPSLTVDNTEYESANSDRYTVNGRTLVMEEVTQYAHYQCNMLNLIKIGEWLDYLRDNGVYDNTRIIIVADHGGAVHSLEELILDDGLDTMGYAPLLMVKDFNSTGFTTCDDFMTNADVPTIAFEGLIENPVNPFTGNQINSNEKNERPQYVISSDYWSVEVNNGYTFMAGDWYSVHDNLWDKNNWEKVATNAVATYDD